MTGMEPYNSSEDEGIAAHLFSDSSGHAFRPQRHRSAVLFRGVSLLIEVEGKRVDLHDISLAGARLRGRFKIQKSERVHVSINVSGTELFAGKASVAWEEYDGVATDFGVAFDSLVDLEKIKGEVRRLAARAAIKTDHDSLYADLPTEYKLLSAELTHHLASMRTKAEALEPTGRTLDPVTRHHSTRRLLQECGPQFQEIWYKFNDVVLSIPRRDPRFRAMKWHTENVLRPHFMGAPVWKRSWDKPLGYPGDYRIMLYAYDSHEYVVAPTLYDSVVHAYLAHTLGACIRGRMALTMEHIRTRLGDVPATADQPCEMLNLGCGAARELPLLFGETDDFKDKHVNIHLVEQDPYALQHAIELALPAAAPHEGRVNVQGLNVSFKDVLRAGALAEAYGPQDVIYSLGLIDYFPLSTGKRMARDLYERLKPGGILTWCNVATCRETCYWPLEFLTDWTLYYRNEAEMREMFDLPGAEITLEMEASKQIWVINAKKPG
jgi:hypothetical protein